MPIHLPPISRREFFQRSLLAGAGVALAPNLFAAERKANANSWAFFADTHIAADPAKVLRGINMTDHFKAVAGEVLALPQRPAGLFVVGDCALNSGLPDDYAALVPLFDPLRAAGLPVHLALGNHDHRENISSAIKKVKSWKVDKSPVTNKRVSLISSPEANWFMLDSLESTNVTPGVLGQEQLDWLTKSLDANPKKPALIVVHHNPVLPGTQPNANGLKDTAALLEIIQPRRQVKAWIFGHTHKWRVQGDDDTGLHFINLPPVAYIFGEGDPAGWVHATLKPKGMRLELRCLDTAHKSHKETVDLSWRV